MQYTVAVRTLGKAGDKYRRLLESVDALQPKPKEVIIALPHGYELPPEQLGYEKFIFVPKGMVSQRVFVLEYVSTDLILFLDDDVEFSQDMFSRLFHSMEKNNCHIVYPICSYFVPDRILVMIYLAMIGAAFPMIFGRSKYRIKVLRSAAYSYNLKMDKPSYEALSGPGVCFLTTREAFEMINFIDESRWLDMMGYAFGDDQTMFYKYHLVGYKILAVPGIRISHLHAKTTFRGRAKMGYYFTFFRYIFWYRFIYSRSKKNFFDVVPFYCCLFQYLLFWPMAMCLLKRTNPLKALSYAVKGYLAARKMIHAGKISEFV